MPPQGVLELRREQRSTRGKRLKAALEEEETKADDEFWNQDYFAGKRTAAIVADHATTPCTDTG